MLRTPLRPGAVVVIRHQRWRVADVSHSDAVTRIDAIRLTPPASAPMTFLAPFDDVHCGASVGRPRRVRRQRWRATRAGLGARAEHAILPLCAVDADIAVLPYQLEPLLAMRDGARRVLIADAVGLGKTIQAGLIVAELMRRREAARVLIAAPSHLCRQWQDALRARLHLSARFADAATLADHATTLPRGVNAWSLDGIWIGSLDFLKQPHILAALPLVPWDLVIIDEAHMVTGPSERRDAAQSLTESARRVVLLTATPSSGIGDGRALIRVGALDADEPLTVFRRTRSDVGVDSRRRVRRLTLRPSADECHALDILDAFARAADSAATDSTRDATHLLVAVLRKRALSTFAALSISVARRLRHLDRTATEVTDAVQASFDFGDADHEHDDALTATIGLAVERERSWMRRLQTAAVNAARVSRKLSRLTTLVTRAHEPVIVFTEFRDSLDIVVAALQQRGNAVVAAHGRLSTAELHAALDAFRDGRARTLVATDVVSQGLNLHQRARWVIHFDRPWNPIRLEQRAGRVDRMGQTRDVHVTELVLDDARDRAFGDRLQHRGESADALLAATDTRWRRRGRAVAVMVERRRLAARAWRGPMPSGRPQQHHGVLADVLSHDIGGEETMLTTDSAETGGLALHARARRVTRIALTRARHALHIERALLERLARLDPRDAQGHAIDRRQLPLPGTATAADVTRRTRDASAEAAARHDADARITELAQRIRTPLAIHSVRPLLKG